MSQTSRVEFIPRKDNNPKQQKLWEKRRAQRLETGEGPDRQEEQRQRQEGWRSLEHLPENGASLAFTAVMFAFSSASLKPVTHV